MKVIHGDLLALAKQGQFDVIIHGCNCDCMMGAGIAKQIREVFPGAYTADKDTRHLGDAKLGTVSYVAVNGVVVANAYTQLRPGSGTLSYKAIRSCFQRIREDYNGYRFGYPRIGAGIAGGDWDTIAAIINEELAGEDHTLVEYKV